MTNKAILRAIIQSLARKWPSTVVARDSIEEFSGGLLKASTMAKMDSLGIGPPRIYVGRKVVYPVQGLVDWIFARSRLADNHDPDSWAQVSDVV
jgi:hypothetical protein